YKASDNSGQARMETTPVKDYILLPLWTADPSFSKNPKSSQDDGFKPSSDDGKKVDEDPRQYPKDSPFDLVAYTDSDYVGASLDRKSTIRGKGSALLADPQHIPALLESSSSQPKKTQKHWNPKRKNTQVPQPSGFTKYVADEAIHKERGDKLVRAATTASSLEAKCQEAIGDTIAQTRFENVFKLSNDSLLARARVDSSEDEPSLGDDASKQGRKINDIDVFVEKDADKEVNDEVQKVVEKVVEDINTTKLIVDAAHVNVAGEINAASIATTISVASTITTEEVTLAKALTKLKALNPKVKGATPTITTESTKKNVEVTLAPKRKGVMIQEPDETTTTTTTTKTASSQQPQVQDK
nr:hypothetical protein [Tanacetum cinerariifolium]